MPCRTAGQGASLAPGPGSEELAAEPGATARLVKRLLMPEHVSSLLGSQSHAAGMSRPRRGWGWGGRRGVRGYQERGWL